MSCIRRVIAGWAGKVPAKLLGGFADRSQPVVYGFRRLWHRRFSVEHHVARAEPASVKLLVAVQVRTYRSALEAAGAEQPARSGVAENLRAQLNVGGGGRIAATRSRRRRRFAADLELVLQQIFEATPVLDDQDDVHGLPADLESDTASGQRQKRGRRPCALRSIAPADDPLAALRADDEGPLDRRGKDGDRFGLFEHRGRDRLVRRGHNLAEDHTGFLDAIGLVGLGGSDYGYTDHEDRDEGGCACRSSHLASFFITSMSVARYRTRLQSARRGRVAIRAV